MQNENVRFILDEKRYVVDTWDSENDEVISVRPGYPDKADDLRDLMCRARLDSLFLDFLPLNIRIEYEQSWRGRGRLHKAMAALGSVLIAIGRTTSINWTKPKWRRRQKRRKLKLRQLQEITSVGLFVADLRSLLDDLYGRQSACAMESFKSAVIGILSVALVGKLSSLWKEHRDACVADGSDRIPGYFDKNDRAAEADASADIVARVDDINHNRGFHGKYTIEFAKLLDANWRRPEERPGTESSLESDQSEAEERFYEVD